MAARIRFGVFELDRDAMLLRKHGLPVRLQEQPCRVLTILAERPGELVTREELQEKIWGDTFVDFDHSLNKAVNRIREALNDNAATPQYVETVPRRGYRFIAPVAASPEQIAPEDVIPIPARPGSPRSRSRIVVIAGLGVAILIAAIGLTSILWLRRSRKLDLPQAKLVNSFGVYPTLSRDGKLLAYMSSLGGGTPHIWVQQTAGGDAIPVTTGPDGDFEPDFSPDGTHIAFISRRNGGGIFIASTLPGEPRLVVADLDGDFPHFPHFSPNGDTLLYWEDQKAFTVSIDGGQPVTLPLDKDFRVDGPPVWSPRGNEILFYGVRHSEQNKPDDWWIAPLAPGQARLAHLPGMTQGNRAAFAARAWIRAADDREWIIYSTGNLESWKLWRIGVSAQGAIDENPEMLASGNGNLGPGGSPSEGGKLAFNICRSSGSIYQISINDRGQRQGATLQLPLTEGGTHFSPSLSRDGKWMAYNTFNVGKPDTILLRDLGTGTDHFLDDKDRQPYTTGDTSISPDGTRVIFERDCKKATWPNSPGEPMPCGFMIATTGGSPEQVCERCTPRGFSSDGSVILLQKYDPTDVNKDRIVALDLRTRTEKDFLSLPDRPVFHAFFSWDNRWVVFKKTQPGDSPPSQILIAAVHDGKAAPKAQWIAVTDGRHSDDKPQFSADGNTVYFTSTRDGYLCIWAQRLDPATKRPLGEPSALEHFHNSEGSAATFYQGGSDLSVAHDKILISLPKVNSEIWMTQMP